MLKIIGYACIIASSILFFLVPVSIEWGFLEPQYLDGALLLLLGLVIHGVAFLFFGELKS